MPVDPPSDKPTPTIHKPKQQRSQITYHHILDTAALMFVRQGVENIGTNHVAAEAGVSVGAFYRFFNSKEALVDALVERYLTHLAAALPHPTAADQPMAQVVRAMLHSVFAFDRQNQGFAQILTTSHTGQLSGAAIQLHLTLEAWVERLLALYHPQLSSEAVHLGAASGMGIVKGMMGMAQPPDSIPFEVVIDEMVETLMAYVDLLVRRNGQ